MHEDAGSEGYNKVEEFPQLHTTTPIEDEFSQTGDDVSRLGERVTGIRYQNEFETEEGQPETGDEKWESIKTNIFLTLQKRKVITFSIVTINPWITRTHCNLPSEKPSAKL